MWPPCLRLLFLIIVVSLSVTAFVCLKIERRIVPPVPPFHPLVNNFINKITYVCMCIYIYILWDYIIIFRHTQISYLCLVWYIYIYILHVYYMYINIYMYFFKSTNTSPSKLRRFYQDGLTGSAWADWSLYTDSPLRAEADFTKEGGRLDGDWSEIPLEISLTGWWWLEHGP